MSVELNKYQPTKPVGRLKQRASQPGNIKSDSAHQKAQADKETKPKDPSTTRWGDPVEDRLARQRVQENIHHLSTEKDKTDEKQTSAKPTKKAKVKGPKEGKIARNAANSPSASEQTFVEEWTFIIDASGNKIPVKIKRPGEKTETYVPPRTESDDDE